MASTQSLATTLRRAWGVELRAHPASALGLGVALLGLLLLLAAGSYNALFGDGVHYLRNGMIGGAAAFGATAFGALLAFGLHSLSARVEDSLLGMAAGMMLAASSFSLIMPGLASAEALTGSGPMSALVVSLGIALGTMLMLGLDRFTPHQHAHLGPHGPTVQRVAKLWLFVFAITLHNLPEGMAIGVSFSQGDMSVGVPLTTAIALQDIPEGLAVAMALRVAGLTTLNAVLIGAASGLMEPLGALFGIGLSSGMALAYPIGLGLAAGAMIFVVSHEVIPETHRNGHQTPATLGLMAGFVLMMVLDTALG